MIAKNNSGSRGMIRLKDIAEKTGYSVNTVSRALQDKNDISQETKQLIKSAAEKMGYIGNSMASSLRSGSSKTVAIILGDISNPHFAIMVKEIEASLKQLDYVSVIFNTEEHHSHEKQAIVAALQKNVDGIIICPAPNGDANIRFLKEQQVPFVLIGRKIEGVEASCVVCDDENGGYLSTEHLLELGHRNILFLNGPSQVSSARERFTGYRRALADFGVPFVKDLFAEIPITMGAASSKIEKELDKNTGYTAILAFSDMIAFEVMCRLNDRGIPFPNRVSVVGFDNIQSKYPLPVPLTSVSSSKITMSMVAVKLLIEQIENKEAEPSQIVLETKLVIRTSTTTINNNK